MPRRPDRQVFVNVDWLAEHLGEPHIRLLDARYVYPNEQPQGDEMYTQGHIPGAIYVHWRQDLSVNTPPVPNLILPADAFAEKMGHLGVDADTTVIVYDVGNVIWSLTGHECFRRRLDDLARPGQAGLLPGGGPSFEDKHTIVTIVAQCPPDASCPNHIAHIVDNHRGAYGHVSRLVNPDLSEVVVQFILRN